jgi:hypothetical protein
VDQREAHPNARGRSKDPSFPQKAEESPKIDAQALEKLLNKAASEVRLLNRFSHTDRKLSTTNREEVPEQEAAFSRLHSITSYEIDALGMYGDYA